ncbi:PREDICTED: torsin-3A isoform X1 [Cercocebus atys]|uniref:torsin-3A isoform X1 n=1 Tax=Cercocebus atys TaxID=9531 RepID=UPI0005F48317|nr:PREDICTED: torsin-3A isoform X1 [Cercocebus atys]
MLRGSWRQLWLFLLLLLLLLLLPGAPEPRGTSRPWEGTDEPGSAWAWPGFQRLQEQLRAAGALSKRYWTLFSCQVWPDDCDEDEEAAARPLGWRLPLLGQRYLDLLTTWYCSFQDCCPGGDCRISNNFTGLEWDLNVRLHGQHLVRQLVLRTVRGYLETPQPDKALALSFHGWSGTGKNFVARMLVENLYRDGLMSDCVRMFIATFHFPHRKYVDLYKEQLMGQIRETQQLCHQTLFIFDEAEKLHPGLLEVLEPHLERQAPEGHRAEFTWTIFLFLRRLQEWAHAAGQERGTLRSELLPCSHGSCKVTRHLTGWRRPWSPCPWAGVREYHCGVSQHPRSCLQPLPSNLRGDIINEVVLKLLKAGWSREEITMEHLEPHLQAEIVETTDNGFGHSRLVKENLIDYFIPFLPLEYRHVRLCARDAFLSQELLYTEETLDEIAQMMVYVPKEEQLFSSQGCKSISQRINYFLS